MSRDRKHIAGTVDAMPIRLSQRAPMREAMAGDTRDGERVGYTASESSASLSYFGRALLCSVLEGQR